MTERVRDPYFNRQSREFYGRRDAEVQERVAVDLDAARAFLRNCQGPAGYQQFPGHTRPVDLENTFGGVCASLLLGVNPEAATPTEAIGLDTQRGQIRLGGKEEPLAPEKVFRYLFLAGLQRRVPPRIRTYLVDIVRQRRDPTVGAYGTGAGLDNHPVRRTWEAVVSLRLAEAHEQARDCLAFVERCFDPKTGGYRQALDGPTDVTPTYNAIALHRMLDVPLEGSRREALLRFVGGMQDVDGFRTDPRHHPNLWKTFDILMILAMLDHLPAEPTAGAIRRYLAQCQGPGGGFRPSVHGKAESALKTYSALTMLSILGEPGLEKVVPETGFPAMRVLPG